MFGKALVFIVLLRIGFELQNEKCSEKRNLCLDFKFGVLKYKQGGHCQLLVFAVVRICLRFH